MSMHNEYIALGAGERFYYRAMERSYVTIDRLAYAAAHLNRFGGAAGAYSVLQHSLLVASFVPPELKRQALIHDLHEPLTTDMMAPAKRHFPEFDKFERPIASWVRWRFGQPATLDDRVKEADLMALRSEYFMFFADYEPEWDIIKGIKVPHATIKISNDVPPGSIWRQFMQEWKSYP